MDDDAAPTVSVDDVAITEGDSGTANATFTLTLSAASGKQIAVDYATADDTAVSPSDYTAKAGSIGFTQGQKTRTIAVAVVGDAVCETVESFTLGLLDGSNVSIADGTGQRHRHRHGLPTDHHDRGQVGGGGGDHRLAGRHASKAWTSAVTVHYATANGTAASGTDYTAKSGTLTIPAGSTSGTISIAILDDTVDEPAQHSPSPSRARRMRPSATARPR